MTNHVTIIDWILVQILPSFGFFLALAFLVYKNMPRRSPSSTIAWLLAIVLVPWIGVPAYIALGGRKIKKLAQSKKTLESARNSFEDRPPNQGSGSIFPVAGGNVVSLLSSGEKAFESLIALIESAEKSIDIATYIISNDNTGRIVLAALAQKAAQGVRIRLLLDALGSFSLPKNTLAPLAANGGQYAFFMPMLHLPFRGRANLRNHRKMVIVDRCRAIVGGMNIAEEYMGPTIDSKRWHDLSVLVSGLSIGDMQCVFDSDWRFATKRETAEVIEPFSLLGQGGTRLQVVPSGPDVAGDPLYESVLSLLFTAKQRFWIVTPYFIPDEMLIKALCIAAKRGVDIRIVLPKASNHRIADMARQSYLRQMQEHGATVYLFGQGMMHGKAILVDDNLAIVGSMNMDLRSFFLNYEIALYMYDEAIVQELHCWVNGLIGDSTIGIQKPSISGELLEGIVRLFAPLL